MPQTIDTSDLRLGLGGVNEPAGRMHHRHAVFHRHALTACRLHIDVASGQAGQDQRLSAVDDMAAVEFCVDPDGQLQPPHRVFHDLRVRDRRDEVPAKTDEHLGRGRR